MTILVTGGTGTLGRLVVPLLQQAQADIRVLSRRPGPTVDGVARAVGDLSTGAGISPAVAGVQTIVHCAGTQLGDGEKARTLVEAARAAGAPHLVFISVVGADRVPVVSGFDRRAFGYYASKRAAERVVEASQLPWTTLRATQFHELILIVARAMAKLPVAPVPAGLKFQPVAAGDVARRLVDLALAEPAGLVDDLGGPRIYDAAELARGYLRATGRRRPVVRVPLPGRAVAALRAGANLTPDHATGTQTWEEFLAENA
jgi:uncharacterized protein YbjT (DUF2867 family)